jgi:hypothetical protein
MAPGFSAAMKDLSFGGDFDSITQFVTPLPLLHLLTSVERSVLPSLLYEKDLTQAGHKGHEESSQ